MYMKIFANELDAASIHTRGNAGVDWPQGPGSLRLPVKIRVNSLYMLRSAGG